MELMLVVAVVAAVLVALALWPRAQRDLRGKVVLLTGAGGGLGRALALSLARRGCRIACVDVASKPNEATVNEVVRQTGAEARAYTADLSKREDIVGLVQTVIADLGHVDILVSNAGQLQGGWLWESSDEQVDLILDVNLRATILLVRTLLPHMRARRTGHFVAISSVAGESNAPFVATYAATKAGLTRFMGCLYQELYRSGLEQDILVTTVKPYFMATYQNLVDAVKMNKWVKMLLPFMRPEDAAEAMVDAVARGDHSVTVPGYVVPLFIGSRLLPPRALGFFMQHIVGADMRSTLSYQTRHQDLDAALMHEMLSKGFRLHQDPEPVCRQLAADRAAGRPLPHDFSPYSKAAEAYYRKHTRPVPEAVRQVFGL